MQLSRIRLSWVWASCALRQLLRMVDVSWEAFVISLRFEYIEWTWQFSFIVKGTLLYDHATISILCEEQNACRTGISWEREWGLATRTYSMGRSKVLAAVNWFETSSNFRSRTLKGGWTRFDTNLVSHALPVYTNVLATDFKTQNDLAIKTLQHRNTQTWFYRKRKHLYFSDFNESYKYGAHPMYIRLKFSTLVASCKKKLEKY